MPRLRLALPLLIGFAGTIIATSAPAFADWQPGLWSFSQSAARSYGKATASYPGEAGGWWFSQKNTPLYELPEGRDADDLGSSAPFGYRGWTLSINGVSISQPEPSPVGGARVIVLPPKTISLTAPNAGGPLTPIPGAPAPDEALGQEFALLINQARVQHGLPPLAVDPELMRLAALKAQDLAVNDYFSHFSPRYGYPYDMMRRAGIAFRDAGENLAGADTVPDAFRDLMASPGHRANILDPNYTRTGWAVVHGGDFGLVVVQEFVG